MKLHGVKGGVAAFTAAVLLASTSVIAVAASLQLGGEVMTIAPGATSTFTVPSATLDAAGYIVAHEGTETEPGAAIGVSALTEAGTHGSFAVPLDRDMQDDEYLWIAIYTESNANTTFDGAATDLIAFGPTRVQINLTGGQDPLGGTQNRPAFAGVIPDRGVALVIFSGGTLAELIEAAQAQGAATIAATVEGQFVVHVVGAPDFVNERFESHFAGGVAAQTALALMKR